MMLRAWCSLLPWFLYRRLIKRCGSISVTIGGKMHTGWHTRGGGLYLEKER